MTIAVTAVVLVLGACGGSEARLSKEEFAKRGSAICLAANKGFVDAFAKAFPEGSPEPDAATARKYFKESFLPVLRKVVDDLDALKPPADLQAKVDTLLAHIRTVTANLEKQADTDPLSIFSYENDPFAELTKDVEAAGLQSCSAGGETSSTGSSS
jgi:hypothetical protein